MPSTTSSNITTAKRTRRANKQHRHRHELWHVFNHPTMTNVMHYAKHFFFKSAFGRLVLLFTFVAMFNIFIFSQIYWPKIVNWLQNSTTTSVEPPLEYLSDDEF